MLVSEILIVMSGVESLNGIIVHNNHSELKSSSSHHLEVEQDTMWHITTKIFYGFIQLLMYSPLRFLSSLLELDSTWLLYYFFVSKRATRTLFKTSPFLFQMKESQPQHDCWMLRLTKHNYYMQWCNKMNKWIISNCLCLDVNVFWKESEKLVNFACRLALNLLTDFPKGAAV